MMKKAIKLLVLAGALLSVGAMAAGSQSQTWNFNWPQYMAIFSSVATVNFDFNDSINDGNTTTTNLPTRTYPRASSDALLTCLLNMTDPDQGTGTSNVETINELTSPTECTFAPSDLDKNWDVRWQSGDSEGALITVSNIKTKVQVKVESDLPTGFELQVAASKTSTTEPTFQNITTSLEDLNSATNLSAGVNFIPLTFALKVDLSSASVQNSTVNRTVTYTISAQ